MSNIVVTNEDIINVTEDSNLTFNNDGKVIVKSNSSLNLTINANVEVILLTNKKIDLNIIVNRHAKLDFTTITFNNKSINFSVDLLEGSYLDSNFIIFNQSSTNIINQTVNHIGRDSYSMVNNKAISFSKGIINFNTIGSIKNGIKNCNCNQLTRGIILDNDASIKATPILLIDEFDVKAYHGATIGNINDDDLFYLMSRGLNKQEAFNLIINGLFKPFFEKVFIEKEKDKINKKYLSFFK